MKEKTLILVPAYNEEKVIYDVLVRLKKCSYGDIIVVEDGSSDNTFEEIRRSKVKVVRHSINRGLGAGIGTGFEIARSRNYDYMITCDSDGQHDPSDIKKILDALIAKKGDVVIGSRLLNPSGMPWYRQILNYIGNVVTFVLFGVSTTDSQSGLRGFNRLAIKKIDIKTNRMEVSSEIISEIGMKGLRLYEVPIRAIYTDYSLSKGQNLFVGVKTTFKLFLRKIMN